MMRTSIHTLFFAGLLLASLAGCGGGGGGSHGSGPSASRTYHLTSAGGLTTTPQNLFEGPVISRGAGISPDGKSLVGGSSIGDTGYESRAILFSSGTLKDLGTLGGGFGYAVDANASGQIVGRASVNGGNAHAFLYENGAMRDLGTLPGGEAGSQASAVNASGQIVGQSWVSSSTVHAFLYENGAMKDLGTLGGDSSSGYDINAKGQIVGSSDTATTSGLEGHAFLYENGAMNDLGTLGGRGSGASGINDAGQVCGLSALANGEKHAVIFENGTIRDLGTLGGTTSYGEHINASGEVIGRSTKTGSTEERPFLYSGGTMRDVNDLLDASGDGWTILNVTGIADDGSLAATGRKDGVVYAVLLTPVK